MAEFIELTSSVSVAGQVDAEDIRRAAKLGFRTIICNRPDSEEGVTIKSDEAAALARSLGMAYHFVPVVGYQVTDEENVDAVEAVLREAEEPVLMYCRSGTRCTLLWAQINVARLGVDETIAIAADNGYDITVIEDELAERANAGSRLPAAADASVHAVA